ncbi:hypothetical protein R3P38DRAFT_3355835 [Favolaschia claudopus]|uniref:F-box domain-containing protein n=1 Tax=Favolaschia claudopus TaxID=2862362 RepID=A0AAW0BJ99_9AGAR
MPVLSLVELIAINTAKHLSPWREFQEQLANSSVSRSFSPIPPLLHVPLISIPPVPPVSIPPVSIPHISIPPISIPPVSIPPISIPHISPVTFPVGFPFVSTPDTTSDLPGSSIAHSVSQTVSPGRSTSEPSSSDILSQSSSISVALQSSPTRRLTAQARPGIIVPVIIIPVFIITVGLSWWHLRRRRRQRRLLTHRISPFTLIKPADNVKSNASTGELEGRHTAIQDIIREDLLAATEKVASLEEQERHLQNRQRATAAVHFDIEDQDVEAQLHAAREEIGTLATRVNALEAGRTGIQEFELPPQYRGRPALATSAGHHGDPRITSGTNRMHWQSNESVDRSTPILPPPAHILDLLSTNESPEAEDITFVQHMECEAWHVSGESILVSVPYFTNDLASQDVSQFNGERDDLMDSIQQYRGILSPIRRIPTEIVTKILRMVFPARMIKARLVHSKDVPLHVRFDWSALWPFDNPPGTTDHFRLLMNTVISHSLRWERLTVEGDKGHTGFLFSLDRIRSRIPRLVKLEFYVNSPTATPFSYNKGWFEDAPSLREVYLSPPREHNPREVKPAIVPSLPWRQIEIYRALLAAHAHFDILRSARNLRECTLLFPSDDESLPPLETNILLAELRRLDIEDGELLDYMTAPALTDLIVNKSLDCVLPFLERSNATLTSLTFYLDEEDSLDNEIVPIFQHCSSLNHLGLAPTRTHDADTIADTLRLAFDSLKDSAVCPALQSLSYYDKSATAIQTWVKCAEDFRDLVASRAENSRLRRVCVFLESFDSEDVDVQCVREMQVDGVSWSTEKYVVGPRFGGVSNVA